MSQQEVIQLLTKRGELSSKQISTELGLSHGTVSVNLKKLASEIEVIYKLTDNKYKKKIPYYKLKEEEDG